VRVLYLVFVNVLALILHVFGNTYLAGVVGFGGTLAGLLASPVATAFRALKRR